MKRVREKFCDVCQFSHSSSKASHAITCAPTKCERLRKYAAYLQTSYHRLRCLSSRSKPRLVAFENNDDRVFPFTTDEYMSCAICCRDLIDCRAKSVRMRLQESYTTISYIICPPCLLRKERLIVPSLMTVAETSVLLLWTLRNVYPRLYRIKDLRRLLCQYI